MSAYEFHKVKLRLDKGKFTRSSVKWLGREILTRGVRVLEARLRLYSHEDAK
jgi:hypothetical protein